MNKCQCTLCAEDYSVEKRVPKVLKCGHTFCLFCLSDFISFVLACPACNAPIEEPVTELPTNYAVLNTETLKDLKEFEIEKKTLGKLVSQQIEYVTSNLQIMTESEVTLKTLIKASELRKDLEEGELENFDEYFKGVKESLESVNLKMCCCYRPEIKPTFTLSSCSTKDEFICEIVVKLFKKNNVYAFQSEWYNRKTYWGKLSYKEGKLLIHSFNGNLPPYPSLFVPFRDLKKCMSIDNFQTFINIAGDNLFCNMLTSSKETRNFVKLCSGELGISLSGLNSKIKMFTHLNHGVAEIEVDKPNCFETDYEFLSSLPSETDESFEDVLQIKMCKRKCKIVKNPNFLSSVETVPEEVVIASASSSGQLFSNESEIETAVEDCGVLLLLPISQSVRKKSLSHQFKLALLKQ